MRSEGTKEHWDRVFESTDVDQLGWYEAKSGPSIELIERCGLAKTDAILDVGSGRTRMIADLFERGHENVIAADLSSAAIDRAAEALGSERSSKVRWIVDDVTESTELVRLRGVRLWHDRAVLHFLTDPADRDAYRDVLLTVLAPGGWVVIGAFSLKGAKMCSGLPVVNYDADSIARLLGAEFELVESKDHIHYMPAGDERRYVYARLRRT